MTCYICQVGALSKAKDILECNMGLVLATAKILFQRKISRCALNVCMYSLSLPVERRRNNITLAHPSFVVFSCVAVHHLSSAIHMNLN